MAINGRGINVKVFFSFFQVSGGTSDVLSVVCSLNGLRGAVREPARASKLIIFPLYLCSLQKLDEL